MMEKLTKAEDQIMRIIWKLEKCLVRDIIEELGDPDIPHSTVSSVVRILEKKNFVNHKAYGRTYEYFPIVSKEEYSKKEITGFLGKYFKGSAKRMVSFLVKEKDLSLKDLSEVIDKLEEVDDPQNDDSDATND